MTSLCKLISLTPLRSLRSFVWTYFSFRPVCNTYRLILLKSKVKERFSSIRIFLLKILFTYWTEREGSQVGREAGRERRGKQAPCWAESPMWGSIPGPWEHNLSGRQRPPRCPSIFVFRIRNHPQLCDQNKLQCFLGKSQIHIDFESFWGHVAFFWK